jgi:hypothetical protein
MPRASPLKASLNLRVQPSANRAFRDRSDANRSALNGDF